MGAIKLLNYLRAHPFGVAIAVWAIFVTCILLFAEPKTVYIETEPEIVTVTETIEVKVPVEVPVETENKAYYKDITLTDKQMLMVCKMVCAEAGNQSPVGKRAVIEVIFNRLRSERWPNTIEGVLTQQGQFTSTGHIGDEWAMEQVEHVQAVLTEETPILGGDCVYFATRKNANGTHYVQIGAHYFAY